MSQLPGAIVDVTSAAEVSTIGAFVLSLILGVIATTAWVRRRSLVQRAIARGRRKALGAQLAGGWLDRHQATADRAADVLRRGPVDVSDELNWLAKVVSTSATVPAVADPSTLFMRIGGDERRGLALADAYVGYRDTLRRRPLVSTARVEALAEEAALADQTAEVLRRQFGGRPLPVMPVDSVVRGGSVTLRTTAFAVPGGRSRPLDIVVSYRRHRIIPRMSAQRRRLHQLDDVDLEDFPIEDAERQALDHKLDSGRFFDAPLMRLVDHAVEGDPASGRARVHLHLAETSFAALMIDSYAASLTDGRWRPRGVGLPNRVVDGRRTRLLTLALVPVTRDGWILLTQMAPEHASGSTNVWVGGNIELREREGLEPDRDSRGMPDPSRAIAREAREEVGYPLRADDVVVTGLTEFSWPPERGAFLLTTTAQLATTAVETIATMVHADELEGAWEVGKFFEAIRMPRDDGEAAEVARWVLWNEDFTVHAMASVLNLLATKFVLPSVQELHDAGNVALAASRIRRFALPDSIYDA